ncbi:hypothetical protein [uncultured Vibrio sp.]|nr:hypothetical protein [uncultured Vibrio sp.]
MTTIIKINEGYVAKSFLNSINQGWVGRHINAAITKRSSNKEQPNMSTC